MLTSSVGRSLAFRLFMTAPWPAPTLLPVHEDPVSRVHYCLGAVFDRTIAKPHLLRNMSVIWTHWAVSHLRPIRFTWAHNEAFCPDEFELHRAAHSQQFRPRNAGPRSVSSDSSSDESQSSQEDYPILSCPTSSEDSSVSSNTDTTDGTPLYSEAELE